MTVSSNQDPPFCSAKQSLYCCRRYSRSAKTPSTFVDIGPTYPQLFVVERIRHRTSRAVLVEPVRTQGLPHQIPVVSHRIPFSISYPGSPGPEIKRNSELSLSSWLTRCEWVGLSWSTREDDGGRSRSWLKQITQFRAKSRAGNSRNLGVTHGSELTKARES